MSLTCLQKRHCAWWLATPFRILHQPGDGKAAAVDQVGPSLSSGPPVGRTGSLRGWSPRTACLLRERAATRLVQRNRHRPSVLRPARLVTAQRGGAFLAVADGGDAAGLDAAGDQVIFGRVRPTIA